jgi:hypothetical protein
MSVLEVGDFEGVGFWWLFCGEGEGEFLGLDLDLGLRLF